MATTRHLFFCTIFVFERPCHGDSSLSRLWIDSGIKEDASRDVDGPTWLRYVYIQTLSASEVWREIEKTCGINIRKQSAAKFSAEVRMEILPETLHGYICQRFPWIYFPQIRVDLFPTDSRGYICPRFAWKYFPKIEDTVELPVTGTKNCATAPGQFRNCWKLLVFDIKIYASSNSLEAEICINPCAMRRHCLVFYNINKKYIFI